MLRPAYESKGATLEKMLNTTTKTTHPFSTKNDDQSFFVTTNPLHHTTYHDDNVNENNKIV